MTAYVGALFAVTDPAALHVLNRWLLGSRLARGSFFRSLYLGFHPVPQITQSLQQHSGMPFFPLIFSEGTINNHFHQDPSTYPLRKSATAKKKDTAGISRSTASTGGFPPPFFQSSHSSIPVTHLVTTHQFAEPPS